MDYLAIYMLIGALNGAYVTMRFLASSRLRAETLAILSTQTEDCPEHAREFIAALILVLTSFACIFAWPLIAWAVMIGVVMRRVAR
jgi:hypothetical protein